ncbi:MAG: beta-ketoacyl synthase [Pseudanabaena sp.]|nr:MAG: beta-ketoacyl synthase [Pseudanabaena sp.]
MDNLEKDLEAYLEPYGDGVEPIAIIGMSGKFPKAKNIDQFWQNLRDGVESISFFNEQDLIAVDPNLLANPDYVRAFGALADIEWFDANFFGFNAREAEVMDPQHRFFLETAWEAIESAGYNPETYNGQIGVYAGASVNSYWLKNLALNQELPQLVSDFQILLGNDKDFVSTRVSYKLNLKGPSINVSTACSTSLVAVQMACQSLLNYQCDMALAGGVAIRTPQKQGHLYQEGMILSPDGHCRAFDAQAKGTVGGSGVGTVVLKRLRDAIMDRDFIYALIRGAAINNDGAAKIGYTAPSINGQAAVITEAQSLAGIDPDTISYIEAHGTGTELGDPIEIAALSQAFRANNEQSQGQLQPEKFCAIGSLKPNVGHLDTAAGIAGLIKTALALHHQQIPPSLNFEKPNPKIDFDNSPFFVNTTLRNWESKYSPRRAGVSSFGIGGTNAHVVLEEAPQISDLELSSESRRFQLLLLSAKTSTALDTATINLAHHLQTYPQQKLADIAYTLQIGRQNFKHRRMLVCENTADAIADLQDSPKLLSQSTENINTSVVFMFSGQGTQYVNMGKDLYKNEAIFREYLDLCCEILKPILGSDLRQIIYPAAAHLESSTHQLQQTALAQPAIFAIAYALAQQWIAWGVKPKAMIGHSIGEYVAACLSGVMTLEEALKLVAIRGKLMQQLPSGAMLAIPLTEQEIAPLLGSDLSIAAINSSNLCVVSGSIEAIAQLEQRLGSQKLDCRRLHTSHAFHSIMMEPMLAEFRLHITKVRLKSPQIPYISNVSGNWITAREASDPDYWIRHIRQPVNFAAGLQILLKEPQQVLLEIGAGITLSTLAKRHADKKLEQVILTSLRHPQENQSDLAFLLSTLGQLWMSGVNIDWNAFYASENRRRLPLPTYPFERQYYWIEPSNSRLTQQLPKTKVSCKKDLADWFYIPSWKRSPISFYQAKNTLTDKHCLIFGDRKGFTSRLITHLRTLYQNVICVKIGEQFSKVDDFNYILNPNSSEDYHLLLADLPNFHVIPHDILHLWTLDSSDCLGDSNNLEQIEEYQIKGFYSLVFLAQALGKRNPNHQLRLFAISNNMQNVTDETQQYPEKSTILGALKVIPKEYPQISCSSIDVLLPLPETKQEQKLINQLVEELTNISQDNSNNASSLLVIAYRGNHRWQQTYEPIHIEANNSGKSKLRPEGVYLITGGLGGIGLTLAEYISRVSKPKLILISRSVFPNRDRWSSWLTENPEGDRTSQTIQQLQALEKQGAEILVAQADVANLEQMQTLVAKAIAKFGKINGLIHCAGVPSGSIMQQRTKSELAQVLAPKVAGTLVLHQIFRETSLDFVVLCSSLSAIFGVFAQVDYCAANIYLDAFAQAATLEWSNPVISINWDTWQQVGMAVDAQIPKDLQDSYQEVLRYGLMPDQGMEVFNRLLGTNLSQVLVSTRDLYSRITQFSPLELSPQVYISPPSELAKSSHARPHLRTTYAVPNNKIEQSLAEIWQQLLGIEPIGIHDNFFELGGHSLLGTQLISRIRQSLQIEMPLSYLFAEPTIAKLADYIKDSHAKPQVSISDANLSTSDREEGEI